MDIQAGSVEIDNRILEAAPQRVAIDAAVRDAFAEVPGEWRIVLSEVSHFSPPWWWVSVEGSGKLLEMSLRPSEQHAEVLRERLVEALHHPL
jgi:hypothetical protein